MNSLAHDSSGALPRNDRRKLNNSSAHSFNSGTGHHARHKTERPEYLLYAMRASSAHATATHSQRISEPMPAAARHPPPWSWTRPGARRRRTARRARVQTPRCARPLSPAEGCMPVHQWRFEGRGDGHALGACDGLGPCAAGARVSPILGIVSFNWLIFVVGIRVFGEVTRREHTYRLHRLKMLFSGLNIERQGTRWGRRQYGQRRYLCQSLLVFSESTQSLVDLSPAPITYRLVKCVHGWPNGERGHGSTLVTWQFGREQRRYL